MMSSDFWKVNQNFPPEQIHSLGGAGWEYWGGKAFLQVEGYGVRDTVVFSGVDCDVLEDDESTGAVRGEGWVTASLTAITGNCGFASEEEVGGCP